MKLTFGLIATTAMAWSVQGCARHTTVVVDRDRPRREVVVEESAPPTATILIEPPPAERVEIIPEPRPGYFWIRGHWIHDGRRYVWATGRYERMPRPDARWQAGRWDHVRGGYVWIEGHWD